jgi:hypothetical protein
MRRHSLLRIFTDKNALPLWRCRAGGGEIEKGFLALIHAFHGAIKEQGRVKEGEDARVAEHSGHIGGRVTSWRVGNHAEPEPETRRGCVLQFLQKMSLANGNGSKRDDDAARASVPDAQRVPEVKENHFCSHKRISTLRCISESVRKQGQRKITSQVLEKDIIRHDDHRSVYQDVPGHDRPSAGHHDV